MKTLRKNIILVAVLGICVLCGNAWGFSGSGSGTESDPYVITDVCELQEMQDDLDAWYELGCDIDASETSSWNSGTGFVPVGVFTGILDGQGFSIKNLYINRINSQRQGLFSTVSGGRTIIKNVNLIDADIACNKKGGSLAGLVWYSANVTNCSATGTLIVKSGLQYTGAGGLIGTLSYSAHVDQCFSGVNVNAGSSRQVGGLVGFIEGDTPPITYLTNSYSYGTVTGTGSKQGNLVGDADGPHVVVDRCYSCGYNKALIGNNFDNAVITNSYWDKDKGAASSTQGGTPKTTAQMMQQSTFVNWDFVNVWDIIENETYPYLRFEYGGLVGLEITGPNEVAENFSASYKAIAHYESGDTMDVTDLAEWMVEPNMHASIENGLLTTKDIDRPEDVNIIAQYIEDGNSVEAEKAVTIFAVCPTGTALEFDGVDDYVEIPDDDSLTPEDQITVSFWIYRTVGGGATINKYAKCPNESASPGNSRAYTIIISGETNKVSAYIASSVNNVDSLMSNNIIPLNEWHYITVTFNHGDAAIYIDGQLDISETMSVTSIMNDHHPLTIGAFWSYCGVDHLSTLMHGQIDEVSIYNRALSAEEIRANMHTRLSGDEPGLVGCWDFDEGAGQFLYDLSGNGNDGQLGSTPNPDDSDPAWLESDAPVGICTYIDFDIKPGSCPNPLNLASKGVLPAAVLGTENFDVNTVDATSVRLAGVAAIRHSYEDVATPVTDGNECECTTEGPDGYTDLTLKFRTQEIVEQLIDTPGGLTEGQTLELNLSGELFDDIGIVGSDCVVLVGNVPKWLEAKGSDINGDGVVNILDCAILCQYWLESAVTGD
ncbi:MAG: LamG-like jellyroll fold domain-containing protein [Planctomycetota bacterium]|jgi:hypothetical protein